MFFNPQVPYTLAQPGVTEDVTVGILCIFKE